MRQDFQLLLKGLDTVQCAYYQLPEGKERINYELLGLERERIRAAKRKDAAPIKLGNEEFLLQVELRKVAIYVHGDILEPETRGLSRTYLGIDITPDLNYP